jgi:acetylornithine aminotransferase
VRKALEAGLLVNSPQENSIRLMPPLIVTEDEIEQLMTILKTKLVGKTTA